MSLNNLLVFHVTTGVPNGGKMAQQEITRMLVTRPNPEGMYYRTYNPSCAR